jgi:addiction module HigA family antidote
MEEFLKPMGITQYHLAKAIAVPQRHMGEIVAGARGITADTGLGSPVFWDFRGFLDGFTVGL